MYLYNKNVLEYAQIARSGPKSKIRDIEGLSIIQQQNGLLIYASVLAYL